MLRVRFEGNLRRASCTTNVETDNLDSIIPLVRNFFTGVELATFIDEFAAGSAFHTERCHQPNGLELRTGFRASLTCEL